MELSQIIKDQYNTLLPPRCVECGRLLVNGEDVLCLKCISKLPLTYDLTPPVTSLYYYNNPGIVQRLIAQAKFMGRPWINDFLMRLVLPDLEKYGWPFDIDAIIPIPVHWLRLLHRGYNQVLPAAEVLGNAWRLPVLCNCLYRHRYTRSQVGLSSADRRELQQDVFSVKNIHLIEELPAKRLPGFSKTPAPHILLIDDVFTTGSTVYAAQEALEAAVPGIRVTILTLARVK